MERDTVLLPRPGEQSGVLQRGPGGGGGDGVDADVGLHDEGVGVGNTAVLRLSVFGLVLLSDLVGLLFCY